MDSSCAKPTAADISVSLKLCPNMLVKSSTPAGSTTASMIAYHLKAKSQMVIVSYTNASFPGVNMLMIIQAKHSNMTYSPTVF